jgi:hypothetical protein
VNVSRDLDDRSWMITGTRLIAVCSQYEGGPAEDPAGYDCHRSYPAIGFRFVTTSVRAATSTARAAPGLAPLKRAEKPAPQVQILDKQSVRCHTRRMLTRGEVERLDAELAALCTRDAAARLRLGQALEVLGRGGCFELGFSSLSAYALERCERGARWVQAARCLARRLEELPQLRSALAAGELSWSQAELVARVASPEDEADWLALAKQRTVREMRALVSAVLPKSDSLPKAEAREKDDEEMCTLVCTVDREDAWLFEATRTLLEQLGTHTAAEQLEALLAEGQGTLLAALPRGAIDAENLASHDASQRLWNAQLAVWRTEAEALCEKALIFARGHGAPAPAATMSNGHSGDAMSDIAAAAAHGFRSLESASSVEIDRHVQDLSRALSGHELEIARRLSSLHRANGWRRLGYATEGAIRARAAGDIAVALASAPFTRTQARKAAPSARSACKSQYRSRGGGSARAHRDGSDRSGVARAGAAKDHQTLPRRGGGGARRRADIGRRRLLATGGVGAGGVSGTGAAGGGWGVWGNTEQR